MCVFLNTARPKCNVHRINFVSFASVMVHEAWSPGTLAIHRRLIKGLHCISSLDQALCYYTVDATRQYV